jgi:hypothetical protein
LKKDSVSLTANIPQRLIGSNRYEYMYIIIFHRKLKSVHQLYHIKNLVEERQITHLNTLLVWDLGELKEQRRKENRDTSSKMEPSLYLEFIQGIRFNGRSMRRKLQTNKNQSKEKALILDLKAIH